ncbi:MAG: hypothetical protein JWN29_1974 [Acidimicrobiales bacterium]|nr:hypothetical protein [Acidimicrobiales bacterium]
MGSGAAYRETSERRTVSYDILSLIVTSVT